MTAQAIEVESVTVSPAEKRKVILAAGLGTVFEWYDFFRLPAVSSG